jgi:hypothetical protein
MYHISLVLGPREYVPIQEDETKVKGQTRDYITIWTPKHLPAFS